MRNLKRVLSLVMMIALLAGLMIVGASAAYQDFTDKDKIENKVAVETLVELNVIAGKEDGSFYDPEGLLTRAEAAKLVCVVLNGGKEPVLGNPDYVSYKDTKGTWGAAYIEYVTSLKIVAGDGQGYFKPDETVTGTQLAKMLLVALNYDANFENLVGNQWDSKTDALANQTELYEGLASGFVTSDPLNRDDAAQIIYNALTAHLVKYTSAGTDGSVGTHAVETNATVLSKYFNTAAVVGMVVANDVFTIANGGAKAPKGKMVLDLRTVNDYEDAGIDTLPIGVDNDMVGQEVTVYVKNYGKTTESILGSVIATENNKIVTTTAALEVDDVGDFLKDNDLTVDANSGVVINGVFSDAGAAKVKGVTCLQMDKAGSERRLIDNDNDGTVDVAFVTTKTLSKVTIYNTKESEITLAGANNKMSFDDIVAYDGIAKGDYVLYVTYGSVTYIEKAQTVTGKVASFNKANNKATIDGTAYAESIVATANNIGLTNYLGEDTEAADGVDMIGETYVFYLDNSGNIIAKGPVVEGAKQYGLVIASNADVNSLGEPTGVIKLVLADGNEVAYNVDLAASADEYLKSELAADVDSTVKLVKADGEGTPLTTGDSKTDKECAMAVRLAKGDGAYAAYEWASAPLSEVAANGMVNHIVSYVVNDDGTVTIAPTQANKNGYNMDEPEKAIRTNSAYEQDNEVILADNSTIYFFVNANGKVTVVTGINSLPTTDDVNAAKVRSVAYTEQDGKYTAKAVVVVGAVKEEGTYVYILDEPEALGGGEYKYPVISAADAGTISYLDSETDNVDPGLCKVTMEDGFATFDSKHASIVSGAKVDQISADGSTLKTTTDQYTVLSTVKVVNVVDTDAPFAAELADLQEGQTISIVKDSDDYVAEIFITADAQQ